MIKLISAFDVTHCFLQYCFFRYKSNPTTADFSLKQWCYETIWKKTIFQKSLVATKLTCKWFRRCNITVIWYRAWYSTTSSTDTIFGSTVMWLGYFIEMPFKNTKNSLKKIARENSSHKALLQFLKVWWKIMCHNITGYMCL